MLMVWRKGHNLCIEGKFDAGSQARFTQMHIPDTEIGLSF